MKQIHIPLINKGINIYIGEEELSRFSSMAKKHGFKDEIVLGEPGDGLTIGNFVHLTEPIDVNTVYHEMQHCIDNLSIWLNFESEVEFKGYIAGYVNEKIHSWLNSLSVDK